MSNEITVAVLGVFVVISQATPFIWRAIARKNGKMDPVNPYPIPGSGERCIDHERSIGELDQCVQSMKRMREDDLKDQREFREDVKGDIKTIFKKIDNFLNRVN